jgi:hypothetical protein
LIAALVDEVRRHHPGCGVVVDPDARNTASRKVLERNGFSLIAVRYVATELSDNLMAIWMAAPTTHPKTCMSCVASDIVNEVRMGARPNEFRFCVHA